MFSGDLGDFLGQLPPTVILAFCGFWLLMVVSLVLLVRSGMSKRRAVNNRPAPGTVPTWSDEPTPAPDLPDLDLLVGTGEPANASARASAAAPVSPAPAPQRRNGTYALQLADGRRVEAVDVLTVSRDLADGSLIVQIGNSAYGHAAEISDAEARRRLKSALRELAQQVTAEPREPQAPPPAAYNEPPVAPPQPLGPASVTMSTPVDDGRWKLPNFNEMANEPLKLRGGKPKQEVPEINIAAAIEAYLQHKVRSTPAFAQRRLHIHNALGGGVRIEVDGQFYEAVSDIEDEPTRAFIAGAIAEWQASQ